MSTRSTDQSPNILQRKFTWEGTATQIVESLGLQNINPKRTPVFRDKCVQVLYNCLTTKVRAIAEATTQVGFSAALKDPRFLDDEIEQILDRFGPTIWGRGNRSHLLKPGVCKGYSEELFFDIPEHRKRIEYLLGCWIVKRIFCYFSNQKAKQPLPEDAIWATPHSESSHHLQGSDSSVNNDDNNSSIEPRAPIAHMGQPAQNGQAPLEPNRSLILIIKTNRYQSAYGRRVTAEVVQPSEKKNEGAENNSKRKQPEDKQTSTRPTKAVRTQANGPRITGQENGQDTMQSDGGSRRVHHSNDQVPETSNSDLPNDARGKTTVPNPTPSKLGPSIATHVKNVSAGLSKPGQSMYPPNRPQGPVAVRDSPGRNLRRGPLTSLPNPPDSHESGDISIAKQGQPREISAEEYSSDEVIDSIRVAPARKHRASVGRQELHTRLCDLFEDITEKKTKSAEIELDRFLVICFDVDSTHLKASMGKDFATREKAFHRWLDMRMKLRDIPDEVRCDGQKNLDLTEVYKRIRTSCTKTQRYKLLRELPNLRTWAKELESTKHWFTEETFDKDLSCVIHELVRDCCPPECQVFWPEIVEYNRHLLKWFVG